MIDKKTVQLSINYGGHDTSAALSIGNTIINANEQERFDLSKHSRNFPKEAVFNCLKSNNLDITNVDKLIVTTDFRKAKILKKKNRDLKIKEVNLKIRKELGFKGRIITLDHHLCHLASAYYPSGFKKSIVLSIDGVGQYQTAKLAIVTNGKIKICKFDANYPHSLGLIYSALTFFLGWKHHCDEGIIMGLAPYGDPFKKIKNKDDSYIDIFRKIIPSHKKLGIKIDTDWIEYHKKRDVWLSKKFKNYFGKKRKYHEKILEHHKNIAAALQLRLEEIVIENLKKIKKKYKINYLCIAGGVGLNCSLNGTIHDSNLFKKIFIQPAAGDAGLVLGGLYLSLKKEFPKKKLSKKIYSNYLGSSFTNKEIFKIIKQKNVKLIKSKNIYSSTANFLKKGKIVAWFQGQSEFGPRALGNRSILCRPYPSKMKDYLNKRVKFREYFRPFAPAVMQEKSSKYFHLSQTSPHMLIACKVKNSKKKKISAVVHVDNSCRVQTVSKKNNLRFYNLIKEFNKITSIPVLLNTSFNVKGQPIVNTPNQAIDTFTRTNIDILVIGDYIITK